MSAYQFKLPDIGEGTAEAEIVAWHVKVGDAVKEDQALVDMMTDKATVELTSPVNGIVIGIAGVEGSKAAVGTVLVTLDTLGDVGVLSPGMPQQEESAHLDLRPSPSPPKPAISQESIGVPGTRPAASPSLRRRAAELGIQLASIVGTGTEGRITTSDFDAFIAGRLDVAKIKSAASSAPRSGVTEVPIIGMRRQIAERMQASKRHIPHFSYVETVDLTALEELRTHLNSRRNAQQPEVTILPFFMTAIVKAVRYYPQINATFDDEAGILRRYQAVHIGMATQTDQGHTVSVVRHTEALDFWQLDTEIARLAAAALDGSAKHEFLAGSTITISSLGALGGVAATPIINRPEVAILCPHRIIETPVVHAGAIVIRKMMNLSSSFDHRVVDGSDAAEFIQHLKSLLEHPGQLFMRVARFKM